LHRKAVATLVKRTAPVRLHKATRWTVAVTVYLASKVAIAFKWLAFLTVLLLKAAGNLIEAAFIGFGHFVKSLGLLLGGLIIFAISVLVLLGAIGILVFGIGQLF